MKIAAAEMPAVLPNSTTLAMLAFTLRRCRGPVAGRIPSAFAGR